MTRDTTNGFRKDMTAVIAESRILAVNAKHGFITLEHFFVAMLNTDCQAKSYLMAFEVEKHIAWLQNLYPNTGTETMEDTLPLTVYAERIIMHADYIATLKEQPRTNSMHLLLAILSYDNQVSELVKKSGLIFEDIAADYFEDGLPKKPIEIERLHFSKPSRIISFLQPTASMENLLEDIYSHAYDLWVYQQYDDCITTCQTGLAVMPTHHDLKVLLAYSFLSNRDFKSAAGCFHELLNTHPDDLNLQISLSYSYQETGDYLTSGEILDSLLAKSPDNDIVLNNKGFSLQLQGWYAEAAPFFEKAIQINPSFAYPWNNLGFVKYRLGDTEQALMLIDKSLGVDKGNAYAYKNKGIIFMEQNDNTQAMEYFQLALKYGYTKTYGEEVLQLIEKCK